MKRTVLLPALVVLVLQSGCTTDPAGGFVLVTSGGSDQVYVLDAASGAVRDSIPVDPRRGEGDEPHGITSAPTWDHWYVTVAHGEPTLWKFTWPENRRVGRVRLGISGASRIGINPEGTTAYVPDYYRDDPSITGRVAVVRLHDLEVLARPEVCVAPHDAQVSANGEQLAVACSGSDEVAFLSTATLEVTQRVSFSTEGVINTRPLNVIWLPGDTAIAVSLHHTNQVAWYSLSNTDMRRLSVGAGPAQLAMTPDGRRLVTANRGDGTASVVSVDPLVETARVDLQVSHPHGIALSKSGEIAFITYEGTTDTYGGVLALDIERQALLWNTPAGAYTLGVIHITHN